jgi:predicted metal-dependent phosphoesterase TrpH
LGRADLHVHTTASDGLYTPAQVADLARRAGLAAVAITDHDTMAGIVEAQQASLGRVEIVSGIEVSCTWLGREVHLLGYFVDHDHAPLNLALNQLRNGRAQRFQEMTDRLRSLGVAIPSENSNTNGDVSLGRRHLAGQLVQSGAVDSIRDAFNRYLDDDKPAFVPKPLLNLDEAVQLVREAGGISSYAHPGNEIDAQRLAQLAEIGLGAVEVEYPTFKNSRKQQLRQWASDLNLAVTGGSDCHGPCESKRAVGSYTIESHEFIALKNRVNPSIQLNGQFSDPQHLIQNN